MITLEQTREIYQPVAAILHETDIPTAIKILSAYCITERPCYVIDPAAFDEIGAAILIATEKAK